MFLIILVLILIAIHLIFRNGCLSGLVSLLLAPVIFVVGFNLIIELLHWMK